MAKTSGLGDNFYIGQYDLSGDVGSLSSVQGGNSPLPVTGINSSGMERIGGRRDGSMSFMTFFNTSAGRAHPALATLPTTDRIASYFRGAAIGNEAASLTARQIGYDGTRAEDGGFTFKVDLQADGFGLEWGQMATAGLRTDAAATAAAAVTPLNTGQANTNGIQAYIHVISLGSGTATVKIQTSSDNSADAYADLAGGGFTAVTGATSERIAVTGAVEQYLKVVTTGTFTNLVFAVNIVVNSTAVSF